MNKELYELLNKLKEKLLHSEGVTLSKVELRLIMRYINELEKEISGGTED